MTIMSRRIGREDAADMEPQMSVSKSAGAEKEDCVTMESEMEFDLGRDGNQVTAEELRDFLAADLVEVKADPNFKEGLRSKLWAFVNDRYGHGGSPPDESD
jgi:hypothetical protein